MENIFALSFTNLPYSTVKTSALNFTFVLSAFVAQRGER